MTEDWKHDGSPAEGGAASSADAPRQRVLIGDVALDPVTLEQAAGSALNYIRDRRDRAHPARITCPNASLIALADEDPGFAALMQASDLVVADGLPLVWAASLLGTPLRGQVRGVDLMEEICAAGASRGMSFYILGGLPGAGEKTAERLLLRNPGLRLAGIDCPPVGFESDPAANGQLRARLVAAAPDFLIVALGSPKQEWWIEENFRGLPVGAIHGVGAAVDTLAGLRKRPPVWMREVGLEWFGRLLQEPQRLWRRYVFGNARFVYVVARQWRRGRRD